MDDDDYINYKEKKNKSSFKIKSNHSNLGSYGSELEKRKIKSSGPNATSKLEDKMNIDKVEETKKITKTSIALSSLANSNSNVNSIQNKINESYPLSKEFVPIVSHIPVYC